MKGRGIIPAKTSRGFAEDLPGQLVLYGRRVPEVLASLGLCSAEAAYV